MFDRDVVVTLTSSRRDPLSTESTDGGREVILA
jgi:hypothetical protein